ncbi:MAG: thioredoxin family protein [Gemmiger sp.]|uniref:thioredoxin family protein n=1 Tax=Gemmiger sp. TaxID=2049027 RepID=UPI002E7A868E|nr:thioredoxin family protein [Gemmiger sp.]MEE0800954.1 thioredoxin family protein [Gemmiger sp.]
MFMFGKKKEETASCCACSCGAKNSAPDASVKVLGSGCAKCNALEEAARAALTELGMDTTIDHVTDFAQIASYGVMATPALVVDGKVVSSGRVLKKEEAVQLIREARAK